MDRVTGNPADGGAIGNAFVHCRAFETSLAAQHSNLFIQNIDWSSANGNLQAQCGCINLTVQRHSSIAVPGVANTYSVLNCDVAGASTASRSTRPAL